MVANCFNSFLPVFIVSLPHRGNTSPLFGFLYLVGRYFLLHVPLIQANLVQKRFYILCISVALVLIGDSFIVSAQQSQ